MEKYDVIIIGTGTAGQTAAFDLVAEEYNVAIIEDSETPGGVCALHGCQAKKWFYEVAEIVARSSHLRNLGVVTPPQVSWEQVVKEKNKFTSKVPENTVQNIRGNGISFIKGKAKFIDQNTVSVGNTHYSASSFIIATGATPRRLPFAGSEYAITSDDFLELKELPQRIAFVGGGFISFEFAHFAARLGANRGDIHIIEAAERVLAGFDADLVQQLVEASEAEGINVRTDNFVSSIEKVESGYQVILSSGDTLEVDLIVNGAGRIPNIESLNLQAAGVEYSPAGIIVDQNMKTSASTTFAIGDCAKTLMLARVADKEAHVAAESIVAARDGGEVTGIEYGATPAVLFTYPQLGMVGKTEEQLKEENITYWKSYDTKVSWPTYRRVGLKFAAYKILVDSNDRILGAHFLSDNVTGMINTFKQAMLNGISVEELHNSHIMAPYPSRESDIVYMLGSLIE